MTQLVSGFDFIDNRMLPVQPYLLFPFQQLPERLRGVLRPLEQPPVILTGFAVFAFPSWSAQRADLFPALLRYTGEEEDVAVCHQFAADDPSALALLIPDDPMNAVETSPTPHGTFFAVTPELIESGWMVKVDGGDFEESLDAVNTLSVLLLMAPRRIGEPCTGMIPKIFEAVRQRWRLRQADPVEAVRLLIAEVQLGLAIIQAAQSAVELSGIMDRKTLLGLKELFYRDGGRFAFTLEMTDYIHKQIVLNERGKR
jgi:hypothetical protein